MNLIFFDGHCGLCNCSVNFLLRMDKNKKFKFASLQGLSAKVYLPELEPKVELSTLIYIKDNRKLKRSEAVLQILKDLGGIWSLFSVFKLIPKNLRDGLYDLVAKHRYKMFERSLQCRVPSLDERERFLE